MKLSQWAKKQGINYHTAFRWFKEGKIPQAHQYDTGTIIVNETNLVSSEDPILIEKEFKETITAYCNKLYGLKEGKVKIDKILEILGEDK